MTTDLDPLSQLQVEQDIQDLSRRLTFLTQHVGVAMRDAAQAEVDFKLAEARKWLELVGHGDLRVAEKEATVIEACADQYAAWKIAEAVAKADREAGLNLRSQLAALQTIAANQRAAIDYSHGRGG